MSKIKEDKKIEEVVEDKVDDLKEEFHEAIMDEIEKDIDGKDMEITLLNNKIKELEDKNLRMSAENINYRRRKDEEVSRMLKYSDEDIVVDLIEIIDNFERALKINSDNEETKKYVEGINMIYMSLLNLLNKYDVKEIEALGCEFDPTYHNGVLTDTDETKEDNVVLDVMLKGYMLKDKVIRPAMVKVNNLEK